MVFTKEELQRDMKASYEELLGYFQIDKEKRRDTFENQLKDDKV